MIAEEVRRVFRGRCVADDSEGGTGRTVREHAVISRRVALAVAPVAVDYRVPGVPAEQG